MSETSANSGSTGIERVLADRYELHRHVARGGMADVYLGRDRLLDRPVAVKILFEEFSSDESFVQRFRREAQNAAGLSHSNIVAVYDWGESDGSYYIVMEYVEGRTLGDVLRSEGPLPPARAAQIGAEISVALAVAHRNGVVHRDIKPGNVLITSGGQVKVTDFGIAQAANRQGDDLTKVGLVIGTASYFSPEQAQGLTADPRSDLYALGCVLYEITVGRPPFVGDSPTEVASKQVNAEPIPPDQLADASLGDLNDIILRLMAKNPADRFPSAEDTRAALKTYAAGSPITAGGTAMLPVSPGDLDEIEGEGVAVDEPPRRVGVLVFSLVLLILVLAGLLTLLADNLGNQQSAQQTEVVPDITDMEVGEARELLIDAGFVPITENQANDLFPENIVFGQEPPAGTILEVNESVIVLVSSGSTTTVVADVVGLQSTQARAQLEAAGFFVEETEDFHNVAVLGEVIGQDPPANKEVERGTQITITISKGPEPIPIPDLEGKSDIEAANILGNLGFEVAFFAEESEDIEEGMVIRTEPEAEELLQPGATVTVILSEGLFVEIPGELIAMEVDAAINLLQGLELQPQIEIEQLEVEHPNDGQVLRVEPAVGEKVEKGTIVILTVGQSVEPTTTTTTSTTVPRTTTTIPRTTTTTTSTTTTTTTTAPP